MSRRSYTTEEVLHLRREYPTCVSAKALAEKMGRSESSIQAKAFALGLHKVEIPLARRVQDALVKDPLATAGEVAERIGVAHAATVSSAVKTTWGLSFTELRREVFEGYWQAIPSTANNLEGNTI